MVVVSRIYTSGGKILALFDYTHGRCQCGGIHQKQCMKGHSFSSIPCASRLKNSQESLRIFRRSSLIFSTWYGFAGSADSLHAHVQCRPLIYLSAFLCIFAQMKQF